MVAEKSSQGWESFEEKLQELARIHCNGMQINVICTHTTKLFMRIVDFLVNMLVLKIIAGITSYILLGFD
jgi:hypothetical protein